MNPTDPRCAGLLAAILIAAAAHGADLMQGMAGPESAAAASVETVSEPLPPPPDDTAAEAMGWHLALQLWSFREFTFYDALQKAATLGVQYVEAYPGQPLGEAQRDLRFGHDLPQNIQAKVRGRLDALDLEIRNYGVVGLGTDEDANRAVFDFARRMGIRTICSEPPPEALDLVEELADEYGINVAIHNHPEPSRYWNPETVLEAVDGRSRRLGACADTGHWIRSGIEPLVALRKLEGRVITFHLKDLAERDRHTHDVPWGTGVADIGAILAEMQRQGFRGVFSIEYEHNWKHSMPEIAKCVHFFHGTAAKLHESAQAQTP